MNLNNIVIVLDHPDESRNIGAACRAMANNDISELRIVGNKADYDIEHIHVLAIHAGGITSDQLEDILSMHNAYHNIGGNGFLDSLVTQVKQLPIIHES